MDISEEKSSYMDNERFHARDETFGQKEASLISMNGKWKKDVTLLHSSSRQVELVFIGAFTIFDLHCITFNE